MDLWFVQVTSELRGLIDGVICKGKYINVPDTGMNVGSSKQLVNPFTNNYAWRDDLR